MRDTCDACGCVVKGGISMGGALLCQRCEVDVSAEIEKLHATGKPVSALKIAKEIFRSQYAVDGYVLRDIPIELWDAAKHVAIDEGMSLRDLLLQAVRDFVVAHPKK